MTTANTKSRGLKVKTNVKAGDLAAGLMVVHNKVCQYVSDAMGNYYWDALDAYNAFMS